MSVNRIPQAYLSPANVVPASSDMLIPRAQPVVPPATVQANPACEVSISAQARALYNASKEIE